MSGIAQVNGEEAIEMFEKMSSELTEVNEGTTTFTKKLEELYAATNMPFVGRLKDTVDDVSRQLKDTKANVDTVYQNLKLYVEQIDAIANGGDI